jgi:hypothetical protein
VLSSGDALAAPGRRKGYDEVQGFTENTTAWSACLIESCCEGDGQLEVVCASKCFGRARFAQFAVENNKGRHQGVRQ